jgi:hypothetical protein
VTTCRHAWTIVHSSPVLRVKRCWRCNLVMRLRWKRIEADEPITDWPRQKAPLRGRWSPVYMEPRGE